MHYLYFISKYVKWVGVLAGGMALFFDSKVFNWLALLALFSVVEIVIDVP